MLVFNLQWRDRVSTFQQELAAVVPDGSYFILVDEGVWATDPSAPSDIIPGRHGIPFLERDGIYWGRPADDGVAIDEVERLREGGAEFITFPWFSFWWLEAYPVFADHLRRSFACVVDTSDLSPSPLAAVQRIHSGRAKGRSFILTNTG